MIELDDWTWTITQLVPGRKGNSFRGLSDSVNAQVLKTLFLDLLCVFLFTVMLSMFRCCDCCTSAFVYKNVLTWFNDFKFVYQMPTLSPFSCPPSSPIPSESERFAHQYGKSLQSMMSTHQILVESVCSVYYTLPKQKLPITLIRGIFLSNFL